MQLEEVTKAVKATERGATPLEGDADAAQEKMQEVVTVMVPDCEHVWPSTVAVVLQL
jgi:hypothetical protein